MAVKIAVVIPFYQTAPGILQKALRSIANQQPKAQHALEIIVVDDGSPVSAESEIAPIPEVVGLNMRVIHQSNSGPAAARNNGLNHVTTDTDFIAFLDSDDEWMPEHLINAVTALGSDFDFYFSDFYQLDQTVSAFNRAGRIDTSAHPTIAGCTFLHRYIGNMVSQIVTGNVIGTSTVVYRYRSRPKLRFREDLVNAGEDYLFWLDFASENNRIAFSSHCECRYGEGVNIYARANWGTKESLERIRYEIKYRKTIAREFKLPAEELTHLANMTREMRLDFAREILHRIRHRQLIPLHSVLAHWHDDPMSFLRLPLSAIQILSSR